MTSLPYEMTASDNEGCFALHVLPVCSSSSTQITVSLFFSFPYSASLALLWPWFPFSYLLVLLCFFTNSCFVPHFIFSQYLLSPFFISWTFVMSFHFHLWPFPLQSACAHRHSPSPLLQACKPNQSTEGGSSGQSLPPHVGTLGQAEDQSCPTKRRRASSPSKVIMTLTVRNSSHPGVLSTTLTSFTFISLSFFCRVIPGPVTRHHSQFPAGTSPHRNCRFV